MDTPTLENSDSPNANSGSADRISMSDLQRAVREADSAALLVVPRILRRVIKQDRELSGFAYRIPHRKSYVIDRVQLLQIVDYEELGVSALDDLPDKIILLAQPLPQKLEAMSAGDALLRSWRLLFHARLHWAVRQCFVLGFLSPSQLRKRIHQLGETEFDEIRAVLGHEGYLLPPHDDASIYEEFVAVFFELKYFAWNSLPRYFPDLEDLDAVAAVLEQDVNAQALFEASRLRGAPDPADATSLDEIDLWAPDSDDRPPLPPSQSTESPSETKFRRALRRTQRPSALGNVVRAAIWKARALRYAPADLISRTKTAVRDDVNQLINRLHAALELEEPSQQPWHDTLRALVYPAAEGFWTAEARLLYDLQNVCVDHERKIHSVKPFTWLWSRTKFACRWMGNRLGIAQGDLKMDGLEPLVHPLPNQRDVLISQHLRTAERRLTAVRLPDRQRKQLAELLRTAIGRVESRLRERFRPLIHKTLDEVGLTPANFPEKIARDKLVEELLDKTAERGFLSIGDLRDALSRNNMKLPDFGGAKDLLYGDPLLKADRRMGEILRGVYRPAEFYLRWLQQLTSLGFGTRIGRFLTLYLAVPFGGAFLIDKGLDHLLVLFWLYDAHHGKHDIQHFESPINWLPLAFLLLGVVNHENFRRRTRQSLKEFFHILADWVFLPLWRVIHSHIVQVVLHSPPFRFLIRYLIKPALLTALIWLVFPMKEILWPVSLGRAAILFVALNVLLNSRIGRTAEEMTADWAVHAWHQYGLRLILGVFWWMVDVFKTLLEIVERFMYGVDEWLRFKSGESKISLGIKTIFGLIWSLFAYMLRFCVNLLIEPQINPIKHFPVVTVSHKLLLPLYPYLGGIFAMHMDKELAFTTATLLIWCIPGIFGFLVWELKENWRLYAANRPKGLQPMIIGSHGETMGRLIRTGFHSGTIPKLFTKLRRADRKARVSGEWKTVRKYLQGLEHVEMALRRYIDRDFLALYNGSRCDETPDDEPLRLREIRFGTNRVRLFFFGAEAEGPIWIINFEVQSGWLLSDLRHVGESGDLPRLTESGREEFSIAILGFNKTAGVEIIRRQLEIALPAPTFAYDFSERGLRIWPDELFETEVSYEFDAAENFAPKVIHGTLHRPLPALEREQVLFRESILLWQNWIAFWDAVKNVKPRGVKSLLVFPVLPPANEKRR